MPRPYPPGAAYTDLRLCKHEIGAVQKGAKHFGSTVTWELILGATASSKVWTVEPLDRDRLWERTGPA